VPALRRTALLPPLLWPLRFVVQSSQPAARGGVPLGWVIGFFRCRRFRRRRRTRQARPPCRHRLSRRRRDLLRRRLRLRLLRHLRRPGAPPSLSLSLSPSPSLSPSLSLSPPLSLSLPLSDSLSADPREHMEMPVDLHEGMERRLGLTAQVPSLSCSTGLGPYTRPIPPRTLGR
jgi:hypothetical protein